MRKRQFFTVAVLALFLSLPGQSTNPEAGVHCLNFPDTEALSGFFRYDEKAPCIVQGHRGTRENGLPENSIAAFEYVLENTPAIFEIDPRLTKDSVVVVFHDATLERTSNGTGRVSDHTWAELQRLNLKNARGEVTAHKIPTLSEVLEWARGRTALILDKKDAPPGIIAGLIRRHDAAGYVLNMVRAPEEALVYFRENPRRMFSVSIRTPEEFSNYLKAGIPPARMFACVGTEVNGQTEELCRLMRGYGIRCLMATASSYDKLNSPQERAEAYRRVVESGVSIIESNYPVEVSKVLSLTGNGRP